jgi:glucose/arabinose dehydrogenase
MRKPVPLFPSEKVFSFLLLPLLVLAFPRATRAEPNDIRLDTIKLPPGFRISVYTDAVPGARSMTMGEKGTLFVGSRETGAVYAVVDAGDGTRAREVLTLAKDLNEPNGVAVKDGALYVMEISRLLRFDDIERRLKSPPAPVVVTDAFPKDPHHGWKFVAFGPDGLLYVPIGAPCNICRRSDPYATITRLKSDGSGFEIVARGVRNTVGFDWHPETKELWFTDNGRDWLGDDSPPDELNRAPQKGLHFGFPYCHGGDVRDPEFGKELPCSNFVPPALKLGAHEAALGMRFYTGTMYPAEYRGQIFIAEHGSWNRKKKVGYRVALVRLRDGKPVSEEAFAEGWLQGEKAWGRPVDVLVRPDGSLLVSDDQAGAIYRISFGK